MKIVSAVVLFCVCTSLSAFSQVSPVSASLSPTIAEVDGRKLTEQDLEKKKTGALLQARYQFYTSQRKALDQLVDDELIAEAARKQNMTVDELLEKVVYKGIKDPTEDQLQVYYEGMDSDEPYANVRDKVLDHIRQLRRDKARAAFVKDLHAQANLKVMLAPPVAEVTTEGNYIKGPKNAPVQFVEFADYECPYCQKVNPLLQKLQEEYGDKVAIVYKDFPLPMHRRAQKAAEAARCAGEQGKFWEYHDVLYYSKMTEVPDLKKHAQVLKLNEEAFNKCLDTGAEAERVKKDLEEGKALQLGGTPSYFVNGHFFHGAVEYSALREIVDQQLQGISPATVVAQAAGTSSGK